MLGPMENKEKVWRISSLTASVDDDTKIMILPLPESKRAVKISETQYQLQSYKDFVYDHFMVFVFLFITSPNVACDDHVMMSCHPW